MKRFLVFFLACFALTVFSEDVYKIALKDGKIIKSDTKPMVSGDRIYFERFGMMLYLPVERVDLKKTEEGGEEITPVVSPDQKKVKKTMKITDEELDDVRKRARLANEDEIRILEASPADDMGTDGSAPSGKTVYGSDAQNLQGRLNTLMDQRSQAQSQVNDLMNELGNKRDQYGFATMAADKDRLEIEIRDAESKLSSSRSQLSSLDNQIMATQQEIASTPVVIETNVPSPPPPQEEPAPREEPEE